VIQTAAILLLDSVRPPNFRGLAHLHRDNIGVTNSLNRRAFLFGIIPTKQARRISAVLGSN
jgi:hypothetical protein